jgi:hypothetical protein
MKEQAIKWVGDMVKEGRDVEYVVSAGVPASNFELSVQFFIDAYNKERDSWDEFCEQLSNA